MPSVICDKQNIDIFAVSRTSIAQVTCSPVLQPSSPSTQQNLTSTFDKLSIQDQCIHLLYQNEPSQSVQEYKLPTIISNSFYKKTILDPINTPTAYKLPTISAIVLEKVAPTAEKAPVEDPAPQGSPLVEKRAAWMIKIRKKMMKKHKLRKLRKRMIFYNRKITEVKVMKKEKKMQEVYRKFEVWSFGQYLPKFV